VIHRQNRASENALGKSDLVEILVPMATTINLTAFWDVEPCNLVEVYRRFTGVCFLHHQDDVLVRMVKFIEPQWATDSAVIKQWSL
jgi:hypothetical protein